jgi:exodeoxyribonuclease III
LDYRVNEWDRKFMRYLNKLQKSGKKVIVAGDFNVAHQDIDVHSPIGKDSQAGFTPGERASFGNLLNSGFTDTYRYMYPSRKEFTFWANRTIGARETNKGWRIDYFLLSQEMKVEDNVKECDILGKYAGSDHAPIKLILK